MQNKLHFAITGNTAAEIIYDRVSSTKENIGLTTWKNAPKGAIRKTDVAIAKNYLNKAEPEKLNRIVTMYLDYAELQAKNGKLMYMKDWAQKIDAFLQFNEQELLQHTGKVTAEIVKSFAEKEFDKYKAIQHKQYESDFDKAIKKLKEN